MFSAQKLLAAAAILLSTLFFGTNLAFAQQANGNPCAPGATPTPTPSPEAVLQANPCNWDAAAQSSFTWGNFLGSFGCLTVGNFIEDGPVKPEAEKHCSGEDEQGKTIIATHLRGGGALGSLALGINTLYAMPPTSTVSYVAMAGRNLGVVPKAYAAGAALPGTGNGVIQPVLALWEFTRNISYMAFIIIFVIIGFMLMFRRKINQQTVISFQAALPSLVIGLILVTFSYFIAALIVDFAFVGMKIVAGIFNSVYGSTSAVGDANKIAQGGNIFNLFLSALKGANFKDNLLGPIKDLVRSGTVDPLANGFNLQFGPVQIPAGRILQYVPIGPPFTPGVPNIFFLANVGSLLLSGLLGALITVVIIIALIIQMGRLIVALVKSYITILVLTILGPFMILIASIPGKESNLEKWWKGLVGNVLVFPAVFAGFMFSQVLLNAPVFDTTTSPTTLPFMAGLPVGLLRGILGYGVILALPAIPPMVTKAIGGGAGTEAFGAAALGSVAAAGGLFNAGRQRAFQGLTESRGAYGKNVRRQRELRSMGVVADYAAPLGSPQKELAGIHVQMGLPVANPPINTATGLPYATPAPRFPTRIFQRRPRP